MDRLVYYLTIGVRPLRLQTWYRANPHKTIVIQATVCGLYGLYLYRLVKKLNGELGEMDEIWKQQDLEEQLKSS